MWVARVAFESLPAGSAAETFVSANALQKKDPSLCIFASAAQARSTPQTMLTVPRKTVVSIKQPALSTPSADFTVV
jgi:hypothetical protein